MKINQSQVFDCAYTRYIGDPNYLGDGSEDEDQEALIEMADNATLSNCIIGTKSGTSGSADGIHCKGSCTLKNVWFEDVGEDAATFYGLTKNATYTVQGGGARYAADKIFQHDGMGTAYIYNFYALNFTRFYRSCGNCKTQYERHVVIQNLTAINGTSGQYIAGVNYNYNDSATLTKLTLGGPSAKKVNACKRFKGVTSGESTSNGTNADGKYCIYSSSDITYTG